MAFCLYFFLVEYKFFISHILKAMAHKKKTKQRRALFGLFLNSQTLKLSNSQTLKLSNSQTLKSLNSDRLNSKSLSSPTPKHYNLTHSPSLIVNTKLLKKSTSLMTRSIMSCMIGSSGRLAS